MCEVSWRYGLSSESSADHDPHTDLNQCSMRKDGILTTGCSIDGSDATWTSDSSPEVSSRLRKGTRAVWPSTGVSERDLGEGVDDSAQSEAGSDVVAGRDRALAG